MIYKLSIEDINTHKNAIKELLVLTYISNFKIDDKIAKEICDEKIDLLEDYIKDGSATIFAYIEESNLLAFTWVYRHSFFNEQRLHINQIAVNPNSQGKGLAKLLIKKVNDYAKELKIYTIDLFVSEYNENALNLYEKQGFLTERRYMKKEVR